MITPSKYHFSPTRDGEDPIYKTYGMDSNKNLTLVKQDTINVKTEELNKGTWENPEPPHSVENIGKDVFKLYRIEYSNAYR